MYHSQLIFFAVNQFFLLYRFHFFPSLILEYRRGIEIWVVTHDKAAAIASAPCMVVTG